MIMIMISKSIATMKNLFTRLMLVAVAAMGFVACQEGYEDVTITPEAKEIVMTFVAEAPGTRTSVAIDDNVATYSWSVDEDGYLTDRVVFLQTQDATTDVKSKYNDKDLSSVENGVATFVTKFEDVADATTYNYAAIFPAQSYSGTTLSSIGVLLPATQTLTENNYDPNADLMMSKLIEGVDAKDGHGGNLQFSRLAAIGRMNLKGIAAGETINKVVITFAEKVVNGNVTLDFEGATASYAETGSNSVTLHNGAITALADGTPIFFTCFPGEYSGAYSVEVTTDEATYSTDSDKSIAEDKALAFTAGNVTRFNLTVGNRVASESKTYTKLTNTNLADYSGTYLLVYEAGNAAFNGSLTTLDAVSNYTTVTIDHDAITGAYSDYTFTITKVDGGYSIQSASGKYIGRSATSNGLNTADTYADSYLNTIENLVIKGSGGATLQYNAASDQNRFRYFKDANQKPIALYRQNGTGSDEEIQLVKLGIPTELNAVVDGNVVTLTWKAVVNATSYDVTVGNNTTNVDTNSATLTLEYETEYTINVVAKGGVGFTDSDAAEKTVTTGDKPAEDEKVWTLVKDASTLAFGDQIIIAASDYNYALSTVDRGNNRGAVVITKSETTVTFGNDVQILTLEAGAVDGTFALNTGSGYLYAASSSSNYLKTKTTLDANGSWKITAGSDGVASLTAQGSYTRNLLKFNNGNNPKIFSCYGSGQTDVAIYRLGSGDSTGGDDNTGDNTGDDDNTGDNPSVGGEAKTYTLTIDASSFNTTSYAANNNEKTSTAVATDGSTMEVKWTSYQVMKQSNAMQWQKSNGYIYNSTDLGTITAITVTSSAGTFTKYIGTTEQPTEEGTGGYFKINVGGALGSTSKVVVEFEK